NRGLQHVLVALLADPPVRLAADRDQLVLAHGHRAEHRWAFEHARLARVDLAWARDRPLLLRLFARLLQDIRRRALRHDLAVDARNDLAALEHRHLPAGGGG